MKLFTWEGFLTIATEVETIVNNLPLSPSQLMWEQDLDLMPLLLQLKYNYYENPDDKAVRHQYFLLSNALDHFRKRWATEYLTVLREKHLNCCASNLDHHQKPGNLVVVKQLIMPRYEWPLGKIMRIFPDASNVV